jgi:hypothetical protein
MPKGVSDWLQLALLVVWIASLLLAIVCLIRSAVSWKWRVVAGCGLGRQPDVGRGAGAVDPDVGVADMLAAGALGPGLPESTPSRYAGAAVLTPLTDGTNPVVPISGPYYTDRCRSG